MSLTKQELKEIITNAIKEYKSKVISTKKAREIGNKLNIDWKDVDFNEFHMGMKVEQEHTDITKGDLLKTGRIALAHLYELPDYYTRLKKMERND